MARWRGEVIGLAAATLVVSCGHDQRARQEADRDVPSEPQPTPSEAAGGSRDGASGGTQSGGSSSAAGGSIENGGSSSGGSSSGGSSSMGGAPGVPPSPESLEGHYDVSLSRLSPIAPEDLEECDFSLPNQLSLRVGSTGIEARVFEDFRWNGWPDRAEVQGDRLLVFAGEQNRDSESWGEPVFSFPVDEEGFVYEGEGVYGEALIRFHCPEGIFEEELYAWITPDRTSPMMQNSSSTGYHRYPFSWFTFTFSEPVGLTGDSHPFGSFLTPEEGEALVGYYAFEGEAPQLEYLNWPYGPVAAVRFANPDRAAGMSGYFYPKAGQFDAAGNPLTDDLSLGNYILDLDPLRSRLDFDEAPVRQQWHPAEYVPPHAPGSLCENAESGCVVLTTSPEHCSEERPEEFAFWVGGTETRGVRLRYRILSDGTYYPPEINFRTGTTGHGLDWAHLASDPAHGFPYSTPFSTIETTKAIEEFPDRMGVVLNLECPESLPGHPPFHTTKFIIEWVAAIPMDEDD